MVAGNWKMNKTVAEAAELVKALLPAMQPITTVEQVICPPDTSLMKLSEMLAGTGIGLGAQTMHWEASGAYTGELSPDMVKEFCGLCDPRALRAARVFCRDRRNRECQG